MGATAEFAWPGAKAAVMGADAAVGILHRKALTAASEEERPALRARLVAEQQRVAGGVDRALQLGLVDEVITPSTTRLRVATALAAAPQRRGRHSIIPL